MSAIAKLTGNMAHDAGDLECALIQKQKGADYGTGEEDHNQIVDECIEAIGVCSFHYLTIAVLCMANAADAVEVGAMGFIIAVYKDPNSGSDVSSGTEGFMTAAVFFGMLIGGLICGYFSDLLGRRLCLLASLGINAIFAFLSAFAPSTVALIGFRFVAGVGVGGSVPSVFTLAAELVPSKNRGSFINAIAAGWMLGSIYVAGMAWLMVGNGVAGQSWRPFAAVTGIPAALAFCLTCAFVPESPRFLARRARPVEAEKVLRLMLSYVKPGVKEEKERACEPLMRLLLIKVPNDETVSSPGSDDIGGWDSDTTKLITPGPVRTALLILCLVWFTLSYGSYGLSTWIAKLFTAVGINDAFESSFIFTAATLPGNLLAVALVDIIGRKILLVGSMFLAMCSCLLFALDQHSHAMVLFGACMIQCFSTISWNMLDCLSTENFPTGCRATSMAILAAVGRLGSVVGQFVNAELMEVSVMELLLCTSGVVLVGSVGAMFLKDTTGLSLSHV